MGTDIDITSFINDLPSKLHQLFELEWRNINVHDEKLSKVLGILAHDRKKRLFSNLARIVEIGQRIT